MPKVLGPGNMGAFEGFLWFCLATGLSTLVAAVLGFGIGFALGQPISYAIAFAVAWLGIYYAIALVRGSVAKQHWLVVERVLKFWDVKLAGLHPVWPFIDRVRERGDFFSEDVELFVDPVSGTQSVVNFTNGVTTTVDASVWYQVADPDAVAKNDRPRIIDAILKWVYIVEGDEREERVREATERALRRRLSRLSFDEAEQDTSDVAEQTKGDVKADLAELGVYLAPGKEIVIRNMPIPENIRRIRELRLQGEMEAARLKAEAGGYWPQVQLVIDGSKDAAGKPQLSVLEAIAFVNQQRAFEMLEKKAGDIHFVTDGVNSMIKTVNVANAAGGKP